MGFGFRVSGFGFRNVTADGFICTRRTLMPVPAREGSVDAAIRLNIDPRKADHALRGLAVLPHGVGNNSQKSSV